MIIMFERVNKVKIPCVFDERRDGDVGVYIADNFLAKSILEWQPKRNLVAMCKVGCNWKLNNKKFL